MEDESLAGELLVTKLYLPPARRTIVARPALTARLASAIEGPLTVVSAPAGFGKTTLISAWHASPAGAHHGVAWLSLDLDDNDLLRFLQYLAAAVDMAEPGAGSQAAALLRLPGAPNVKTVLSALLNGLVAACGRETGKGRVVLVLDDYHAVNNQAVHEAVAYLLDHLPACLRLVILSRVDPPLPLSRLRVRGQLTELRAADLRFSAEEAAAFLNGAMGLDLPAGDVASLEARTEGWIAALQLAAICLTQPQAQRDNGHAPAARFIEEFGASNRYVAEYLMDEVLGRQPPHVQAFLLGTSILERLCAPLCEAVLSEASGPGAGLTNGGPPAQEVLAEVERGNLFLVPLDDQGYWYRYHHLFRDFLHGRLVRLAHGAGGALTSLHLAASEWYEANGYLNEAVRHAVQSAAPDRGGAQARAGDLSRAADLVERYANPMLCRSEVKTLQSWYAQLPDELIRQRPMLAIYHAWALNLLPGPGSHEVIVRRLAEAEALVGQTAASQAAPVYDEAVRRQVAGHAATIRVYFLEHAARSPEDYQGVVDLATTAEELLPDSELTVHGANQYNMGRAYTGLGDLERADAAFEESRRLGLHVGNDYVAASSFYYRGRIAYLRGRLHEAAQMLRAGIEGREWFPPRDITRLPALGAAYVGLGCTLLEWNALDEAEAYLRRGLDALQYAFVHGAVEAGHAALARLLRIRGDAAASGAAIERLSRVMPVGEVYAAAVRAACRLSQSPLQPPPDLVAWARQGPGDGEAAGIFGANAWGDARYLDFVTRARVEIAAGAPLAVLGPLGRRAEEAEAHGVMLRAVELRLVQALALNALGENKRAFESLQRALELAEPAGMVRVFDGGPAVEQLLAQAAGRSTRASYANRLLAALYGWGSGPDEVAAGEGASKAVTSAPSPTPTGPVRLEELTEREQEILELIAQGLSNAEIAARLYVEVSTVKRHVNHILGKIGAANRTQAVARARALGLLK